MNKFEGIVTIIGNYGVGKTVFALSTGFQANEILLFNNDLKTPPDADYFGLENIAEEIASMNTKQSYEYIDGIVSDYESRDAHPKVIIFDPWTDFGKLCRKYIEEYPGKAGVKFSPKTEIRNGEVSREGRKLETSMLSRLKSMAQIVILTIHPKPLYINNTPIHGKSIPDCTKAVDRETDLKIWLTNNPDDDAPIGLVLKNIAKFEFTDSGLIPKKLLPQKINPCTWHNINAYYDDPIGGRDPLPHEIPNAFERSIIDGSLTPEQQRQWQQGSNVDMFEVDDSGIDIKALIDEHNISGPPPMKLKKINEVLVESGQVEISMDEMNEALK